MDGIKQLQEKLHLPRVSQIGVVVRNMEKAVENYESIFGLGPFTVYEFVPDRHWYMEEPSPLRILMGKAIWEDAKGRI
ncbi:MAG: hypothetical protein JRJ70_14330 [Deltaproteobacteria bacterium]|nr:hypothetical protein [Deltaproteobacteria bacterium]